jgi:hypothetical protein
MAKRRLSGANAPSGRGTSLRLSPSPRLDRPALHCRTRADAWNRPQRQAQADRSCLISWKRGHGEVEELAVGAQRKGGLKDEQLIDLAEQADKVAIDSPFGWPAESSSSP